MTAAIRRSTHMSYSVENFVLVYEINYPGLWVKSIGDILVSGQIGRLKYLKNKVIIYKWACFVHFIHSHINTKLIET